MQVERRIDHQIEVEGVNQNGSLLLRFSDGQTVTWPVVDSSLASGKFYLALSPTPVLPTKAELAKLVLQQILKQDQ